MIRTILRGSVSFCPSFCIIVLLTARLLRAGNAAAALQISNETAPAGGFAQIKIYATKPTALSSDRIIVTLDQTFFANTPQVGLFGADGDALGLATLRWPQIDIQYSSASKGIGLLAGLPVIVISVPVLATATGTTVVSATSLFSTSTVTSGSVTVQGKLSVGKIPAGLGVAPAGTVVPITGTGFTSATTVAIDGVELASANFVSSTEIDVTLGGAAELVGKRARVTDAGAQFDYFCFQPNDPVNFPENTFFGGEVAAVQPLFPVLSGTGFSGYTSQIGGVIEVQNPNLTSATVVVSFAGFPTNGQTDTYPPLSIPPGSWAIFDGDGNTGFSVTSDLPVRAVAMDICHGIATVPACVSTPLPSDPAATVAFQGPMLVPSTLGFVWQVGSSSPPATQTVTSPAVEGVTTVSVAAGAPWLSASVTNLYTIAVAVNPANLAVGTYLGSVVVGGYLTPTLTLPVTLNVTNGPVPSIVVVPPSVSFTAPAFNATPYSQSISVASSAGSVPFTATAIGGPYAGPYSWLKVTPTSGTTPATVTVTWDPAVTEQFPIQQRTTNGSISIAGPANSLLIPATFNVTGVQSEQNWQWETGRGPNGLVFSAQSGTGPQTQPIVVDPPGTMTAAVDQPWMTAVEVTSGQFANRAVNVTINPAGLAPGAYTGNVTIAEQGLAPVTTPVTLGVWTTAPKLTITKSSFTFLQQAGEPAVPFQYAEIDSGGVPSPWGIGVGGSWLLVNWYYMLTPAPLQVGVQQIGLFPPGQYDGSFTLTSPGGTVFVPVTFLVTAGPAVQPVISQVANAASGIAGGISPGEILELRGYGAGASLIAGLQLTSSGIVATNLNGLMVTFDGVPAPLIYTSATQTNLVVPYEVAGKTSTTMQLTYTTAAGTLQTSAWVIPVAASAPGIFTVDSTGTGQAAVVNQDKTVNSAANPAARGSVVSIYATGEGQTSPAGVTGRVTKAPNSPVAQVSVSVGGVAATVQYAGSAPGDVAGVLQVNAVVPASVGSGSQAVTLTVGGVASQPGVTIAVK
jgi:uncharacterized protein (TIGR03437 family)